MIVVLVHILIFGYTKFHQHDVYCTPSTKKLSTALWHERQMQFWQNQINFALWCATSGCGVSMQDHLTGTIPLFARSLFLFHVYYQTRRILFEMKVALPTDDSWNAFDNSYDKKAYERICDEFGVSVHTNWRQEKDLNQGLGTMYNYWTNAGYHPLSGAEYDKKGIHLPRLQQIHYYTLITLHKVFLRPGLHSFSTSQMASQDPALNE